MVTEPFTASTATFWTKKLVNSCFQSTEISLWQSRIIWATSDLDYQCIWTRLLVGALINMESLKYLFPIACILNLSESERRHDLIMLIQTIEVKDDVLL